MEGGVAENFNAARPLDEISAGACRSGERETYLAGDEEAYMGYV